MFWGGENNSSKQETRLEPWDTLTQKANGNRVLVLRLKYYHEYTQCVLWGTPYKGQSKNLRKFKGQDIRSLPQSRDRMLLLIKGPYAKLQIQGTEIQSQLKVSIFPTDIILLISILPAYYENKLFSCSVIFCQFDPHWKSLKNHIMWALWDRMFKGHAVKIERKLRDKWRTGLWSFTEKFRDTI